MPLPNEQMMDFLFPFNGIDLYSAFATQRQGTTRTGVNVRAFEPSTQRARGGNRPGLSKYIPPQLPTGAHLVQHLSIIVDPTPLATQDDAELDDPNSVVDPTDNPPGSDPTNFKDLRVRNRGRRVRKGGWGRQPNRNRPPKQTTKNAIKLVQTRTGLDASSNQNTLPSAVKQGRLIVVFALHVEPNITGATDFITDSLGNVYGQAGGYVATSTGILGEIALSLWWTMSQYSGPCTVTVSNSQGSQYGFPLNVSEWANVSSIATLAGVSNGVVTSFNGATAIDAGAVNVTTSGQLVISIYDARNSFTSVGPWSPSGAMTALGNWAGFPFDFASYKIAPAVGSFDPVATTSGGFNAFGLGLAAIFNHI